LLGSGLEDRKGDAREGGGGDVEVEAVAQIEGDGEEERAVLVDLFGGGGGGGARGGGGVMRLNGGGGVLLLLLRSVGCRSRS
jgi:hypothetical protein